MEEKSFTVLIAGITKPGMEDYVRNFLKRLMTESRKEKGCITYNIHESTANPGEFMLYSVWENEETFNKHNEKPLMQEFKRELSHHMFDHESPKTYWVLLE